MILAASLFNTPIDFFKSEFAADTSKDVSADAGKDTVEVKWYANSGKYWWNRSAVGYSGYVSTGKTSADAVSNWLRNTLSATQGMGVKFLSLAPHDTVQPIDCEMFAWGSWSNWSEWSDCVDGSQLRTRTKTRSAKTPAANGGTACPTDLEQTETETQTCGGTTGRSDNGDGDPPLDGTCADPNDSGYGQTECIGCNAGYEDNNDGNGCVEITDGDEDEENNTLKYIGIGGAGLIALIVLSKVVGK